jgi:hypothetical protein
MFVSRASHDSVTTIQPFWKRKVHAKSKEKQSGVKYSTVPVGKGSGNACPMASLLVAALAADVKHSYMTPNLALVALL